MKATETQTSTAINCFFEVSTPPLVVVDLPFWQDPAVFCKSSASNLETPYQRPSLFNENLCSRDTFNPSRPVAHNDNITWALIPTASRRTKGLRMCLWHIHTRVCTLCNFKTNVGWAWDAFCPWGRQGKPCHEIHVRLWDEHFFENMGCGGDRRLHDIHPPPKM